MTNKPCVLVAEVSVINTLRLAIIGLQKYSDVNRIDVIVPEHQLQAFINSLKGLKVNIIPETQLIPADDIAQIKQELGVMAPRFGWYLQQFLKWQYRNICNAENYLIWDADTVLVDNSNFFGDGDGDGDADGEVSFNMAKEYHKPYFDTMSRAFGLTKQVEQSFISQYMLINVETLNQLIDKFEVGASSPWFLSLLSNLDRKNPSEFSEYETYGTFILTQISTEKVNLKKDKWFRYGSDVFKLEKNTDFSELEKKFSAYRYVAFERHERNILHWIFAHFIYRIL